MLNTVELFAGCGGLLEGFEKTGRYRPLAAVEWEKAPCENLRRRLKNGWGMQDADERVIRFDIQRTDELFEGWKDDPEYGSGKGLSALIGNERIDVVTGGPPCQAYSIAGRVRDENGMRYDYRNYLFESYLRAVSILKPKAVLFENVPGLLSAKPGDGSRPIAEIIREEFEKTGYSVPKDFSDALADMTEYGVPQNRKRLIILGLSKAEYGDRCGEMLSRYYKELLPEMKVSEKKTVRDAIGDLPPLFPLGSTEGKGKASHGSSNPPVDNHVARWHSERDVGIFRMLAEDVESGENRYASADALKKLYSEMTGKTSNVHKYHVIRWDEPSNLIPAHLYKDGLRHIHPDSKQARSVTVREAARLQTFPDDYVFIGSAGAAFKMIGNAVPPLFAEKAALALSRLLEE